MQDRTRIGPAWAGQKERRLQFMRQAGLALATTGSDAAPAYSDGVGVFTLAKFGLMGELTVSGAKLTQEDLE